MTIEEDQSNTTNQTDEPVLDVEIDDEEKKIREEIANDFHVIISQIKTPFENITNLMKNKIISGSSKMYQLGIDVDDTFFLLNEREEYELHQNLINLNETLGAAHSTLDSYVKFTKSSPDFDKFLNLIFIFIQNHLKHRKSLFFQVNAEKDNYLYPYMDIENILLELHFLYARLCGTLSVGARWTIIQPPTSQQNAGYNIDNYGDRFGLPYHDPYESPYRQKPKLRDIGDAYS